MTKVTFRLIDKDQELVKEEAFDVELVPSEGDFIDVFGQLARVKKVMHRYNYTGRRNGEVAADIHVVGEVY